MGVVFRAHDTQLQRDVALKLLPNDFASDPDLLSRFQREAQVLALLNHPNIAQIYGLEGAGESRCIVMELVDGETLAERLKRGALHVDEALRFALDIAEALDAAHEKGIVHRDLKPANIKITPEGRIKVLDFGLAKVRESESARAAASNSPTMMSSPGMIMGTAAYMSPEQAKGRTVDKRSDIFSFGCVLYEMLTGREAFGGEDVPDIVSRVLQREPDWSALPPDVSPQIAAVLRRCLEKDVKKRRRDMGDVRIDIEQALKEPAPGAMAQAPARSSRLAWILLAVAGMLIVILSIPTTLHLRERVVEAPEMRVEINTPVTPQPLHFALSPDGMRLVFVAAGDGPQRLWWRPLDSVTAQPLTGTEGAEFPFWSADSRAIGFF